jgi:hypothetical protein
MRPAASDTDTLCQVHAFESNLSDTAACPPGAWATKRSSPSTESGRSANTPSSSYRGSQRASEYASGVSLVVRWA